MRFGQAASEMAAVSITCGLIASLICQPVGSEMEMRVDEIASKAGSLALNVV